MSERIEVDAAAYQQQIEALKLFDKVWNDPEAGESVRRAAKRVNPNITIPDEHPVALKVTNELTQTKDALAKLQAEFESTKSQSAQKEAEAALRRQLGEVQTKYNLTDDGMAKTIELMQQRQLADPEAAALLYRESLPKVAPQSASNRFFDTKADMFGTTKVDERWSKLHTDEAGFFADVVNEVFAELPPA